MAQILILDDDSLTLKSMGKIIEKMGYTAHLVNDRPSAMAALQANQFDLVISDLYCPRREDGLSFVESIGYLDYKPAILMVTGFSATENVVDAMKAGADDFIPKGFSSAELQGKVSKLLDIRRRDQWFQITNHIKEKRLRREFWDYHLIGNSPAIQQIRHKTDKIAGSKHIVCLIEGETGTGKELVARVIHRNSQHKDGPFVALNCDNLTETSFEQELFGFEASAFPDAVSSQKGKLELAHGGTLLLDMVDCLDSAQQKKLLHLFEETYFNRIGGYKPIYSNAFIIATSKKDLREEVAKGRFSEAVFYRLNVVKIRIPPLREHPEDIPELIQEFLQRFNEQHDSQLEISAAAVALLRNYHFPGNIRELKNILECAAILTEGRVIEPSDIQISNISPETVPDTPSEAGGYHELLRKFEREQISRAFLANGKNIAQTARALNLSEPELQQKLKELQII